MESAILLWIQDFEHGARRVAVVVATEFVDFVQYEKRVGCTGLFQVLQNASGHGSDVCFAVPADFRFIAQPTQAHPHVFTAKGLGNAAPQRGLSDPRRPVQADDGCL